MAESIVIQLDLETGDTKSTFAGIEKNAKKAGTKTGKTFAKSFAKSTSSLLKTATKIAGAVGTIASALTFRSSIIAAQEQEDAINQLNSALQISGKFSEQASQDLQNYAASLQQVTRFGDEAILRTQGLIQSLGNLSKNELKDATQATLDLAAALKIDLNTAATLVGKAAAGEVGTFSRYGLTIKKASDNTKTFANALTAIQNKFGGAAQKEVLTFSGATQQLSNTFGDLLESIGFIITKNDFVLKGIKNLNVVFQNAIKSVDAFRKSFNIFDDIIEPLVAINKAIIDNIVRPFEIVFNVAKRIAIGIGNFFVEIANSVIGFFQPVIDVAIKAAQIVGQNVGAAFDVATASIKEFALKSNEDGFFKGVLETDLSSNLNEKNDELRNYFAEQQSIITENASKGKDIQNQQTEVAKTSLLGLQDVFGTVFSGINTSVATSEKKIQEVNDRVKKFSSEAANSLRQGLATGAGQAFKAFGAALANGENALQAFTDSLLKTLADQAVALGTKFILEGAAYAFLPGYQALSGPLIAAGAALAAFGGALGATIGGGDSGGGGGGGATTQDTNEFLVEETTAPGEVERTDPSTNVEVVVQGSLVQQEELGTFIAETLSDSFGKQGVALTDARIA
jgi:hypothetical protein